MKIRMKNLGALKEAEFELGEFTIICGSNNTGKTYATYALFGFLSFWYQSFSIEIPKKTIHHLMTEGSTELRIDDYIKRADDIIKNACDIFTHQLPDVFASLDKHFENTEFMIDLDGSEIPITPDFKRTMGAAKKQLFSITKKPDQTYVTLSLLVEKEEVKIPTEIINQIVGDALKDIIFGDLFPKPFIASAERTGAAIFRKELNFARNRLLEEMSSREKDFNPMELLTKGYSDYAWPVTINVDFTRQLESVAKKESFLVKEHQEVLQDFSDIIGGNYKVTKHDELFFEPKGKRIKLTMDESSSAVRSLLDIGFYLNHVVQPGDLLMVDEPELNLHPENQRRLTRIFARLVNLGIKIFITTHSDYIIKELNTLIMLNHDKPHLKRIAQNEGYIEEELISANNIRVYIADEVLKMLDGGKRKTRCLTLTRADIDPELGIEARSFDSTIDDMNRIQEEIIWGE